MIVVDASVVIKSMLPESDSAQAEDLIRGDKALLAPAFIHVEVRNILLRAVRQSRLAAPLAEAGLREFGFAPISITPDAVLMDRAWQICRAHGGSIYDGLYVALADISGSYLISADAGMIRVARSAGLRCGILADGLPPPA